MKRFLTLVLVTLSLNSFAQFDLYNPDGSKLPFTTLEEANERFKNTLLIPYLTIENYYDTENGKGIYTIMFEAFTNKPVYLICKNPDIKTFNSAIQSFNLSKFIESDSFSIYLDKFIKEGKLYEYYITNSFGKPIKKSTKNNGTTTISTLTYTSPKIVFYSTNHIITSYELEQ